MVVFFVYQRRRVHQRGDRKDGQYQPDSNNTTKTSNDVDDDDDETYLLHVLGSGSRILINVNIALDLIGSSIFVNKMWLWLKQQHCQQHNDDDNIIYQ